MDHHWAVIVCILSDFWILSVHGSVINFASLGVDNGEDMAAAVCRYNNVTIAPGHRFKPEPCMTCRCPARIRYMNPGGAGRVHCIIQDCHQESNCLRYQTSRNDCCGTCVQYGCHHGNHLYTPGDVIRTDNPCETCVCPSAGGQVECTHPVCPNAVCVDYTWSPGKCCPLCPKGNNCWLDGAILRQGVELSMTQHGCQKCRCPDRYARLPAKWTESVQDIQAVCVTYNCTSD